MITRQRRGRHSLQHGRRNHRIGPVLVHIAGATARWCKHNTFTPPWLPAGWSSHALGYGCAVLSQLLLLVVDLAFKQIFVHGPFPAVLLLSSAGSLTLAWGIGPGLCSLLWGTALLVIVLIRPAFSVAGKSSLLPSLAVFLLVGSTIILLASQMMQNHRRAVALNQRMIAFLNTASHELRTPLTSQALAIRLAQRQVTTLTTQNDLGPDARQAVERIDEFLRVLEEQTVHQGHLVNTMLDAMRTSAHGSPTDPVWEKAVRRESAPAADGPDRGQTQAPDPTGCVTRSA
jgi:signal transduction histidine kinase